MNKKNMRQKNMKSKLIAAVAMLLVSCIMMVSSTYAWFTLSTAPEVQGITTTVGANGNLEIALSPLSGDPNEITSGVGDANLSWVAKNQTWGNLLDLSDPSYGLGEITLLPAQLNITPGADQTQLPKLNVNPLKVATYGADGRIDTLSANGVTYGAKRPASSVDGFIVNNGMDDAYGIRAVGTSSTQSETVLNFQNALSAISNNRGAAYSQISGALGTYGDTLAAIALKYANGETSGYEAYLPDLNAMLGEMEGASDKIETALYNALLAISLSRATDSDLIDATINVNGTDMDLYDGIKNSMETGIGLETVWANLAGYETVLDTVFPALGVAYDSWASINANVSAARAAYAAINSADGVTDSEIRTVVSYLMDTADENSVTINGLPLADVKAQPGKVFGGGASGINLQLNEGSGVFAEYAVLTGNVTGTVTLPDGTIVGGMNVGGATISLMTTTEPATGPMLNTIRSTIALLGVTQNDASSATSVIDTTYGYALDFIFRTNAANSSLLLQSDAAQRIYGDSNNAATMGAGSTLTFGGTTNGLQTLVDMMSGIRVVFTETAGDSIYGIAKVTIAQLPMTFAAKTVEVGTDAAGNPTYTENGDADLDLALTVTPAGAVNAMTWSFGAEAIANNQANAVMTLVQDTATNTSYQRVAVTVDGDTTYYHIHDQAVELVGELSLYNYTVNELTNALEFTTIKDVQSLCVLDQNVATRITALVYLDGDYIDNSDVSNSENGISNTGSLNLQFASSANLVPMNNSDLKNGYGVELPEVEGADIQGKTMVAANADYVFTVSPETGYTVNAVTYAIDGVNKGALAEVSGEYKIEKANITGNIEIFVEVVPTP